MTITAAVVMFFVIMVVATICVARGRGYNVKLRHTHCWGLFKFVR